MRPGHPGEHGAHTSEDLAGAAFSKLLGCDQLSSCPVVGVAVPPDRDDLSGHRPHRWRRSRLESLAEGKDQSRGGRLQRLHEVTRGNSSGDPCRMPQRHGLLSRTGTGNPPLLAPPNAAGPASMRVGGRDRTRLRLHRFPIAFTCGESECRTGLRWRLRLLHDVIQLDQPTLARDRFTFCCPVAAAHGSVHRPDRTEFRRTFSSSMVD